MKNNAGIIGRIEVVLHYKLTFLATETVSFKLSSIPCLKLQTMVQKS